MYLHLALFQTPAPVSERSIFLKLEWSHEAQSFLFSGDTTRIRDQGCAATQVLPNRKVIASVLKHLPSVVALATLNGHIPG